MTIQHVKQFCKSKLFLEFYLNNQNFHFLFLQSFSILKYQYELTMSCQQLVEQNLASSIPVRYAHNMHYVNGMETRGTNIRQK